MENRLELNSRELRQAREFIEGKMPPQSKELEESVIGLCLSDHIYFRRASMIVRNADVFYYSDHKSVWLAMMQLEKESGEFDMIMVAEKFRVAGRTDGVVLVSRLMTSASFSGKLEQHCFMLVEYFMRREMIMLSIQMQAKAYDMQTDIFDTVDMAKMGMDAITDNAVKKSIQTMETVVMNAITEIRQRMESPDLFLGLPLPVRALYNSTHGLHAPDLTVIAARPAMGKTAVVLSVIYELLEKDIEVGGFFLEMSNQQIINRMICLAVRKILNKVLSNHALRGRITPGEYQMAEKAASELIKKKLFMDDTAGLSFQELRSKAVTMKSKYDIKLLVVDYLQLVTQEKAGSREQEVSQIVRGLKNIAKELNIPVIALSQLSRKVEERSDKRPLLSDLRETGEIEQAADNVIFLYRPEYYGIPSDENGFPTKGLLEFIIAKQRNGSIGAVPAFFEPASGLVADWDTKPNLFTPDVELFENESH